jgi:aminomethyltransferase
MNGKELKIGNVPVYVTRCGYTGEDGFEISATSNDINEVAEAILKNPYVKLAGLGARDTLRLEAGLCLYGHDIDEKTTPTEAGLSWLIAKSRRLEGQDNFMGSNIILEQLKNKSSKIKRSGFIIQGAPAREGAKLFDGDKEIGKITSGCPSPILKKNIGMGYILKEYKIGDQIQVEVRNRRQNCVLTKMPFIEAKYYK